MTRAPTALFINNLWWFTSWIKVTVIVWKSYVRKASRYIRWDKQFSRALPASVIAFSPIHSHLALLSVCSNISIIWILLTRDTLSWPRNWSMPTVQSSLIYHKNAIQYTRPPTKPYHDTTIHATIIQPILVYVYVLAMNPNSLGPNLYYSPTTMPHARDFKHSKENAYIQVSLMMQVMGMGRCGWRLWRYDVCHKRCLLLFLNVFYSQEDPEISGKFDRRRRRGLS